MANQEALRDHCHDMLALHGYISVELGVTGTDIDPIFGQFQEFLDLCDQPGGERYREALAFTPTDPSAGGDYFVTRRRVGMVNPHAINAIPGTEEKDVAHIGPRSQRMAIERLGGGALPRAMQVFLSSCIELQEASKTSARPVLDALGLRDVVYARDHFEDEHVVRVLRYLGGSATLANLHFDRSVVTVAPWESHEGLVGAPIKKVRRRSFDINELDAAAERAVATPINHRSGTAKVFLGAGYDHLNDEVYEQNGALPLLLHGVLNKRPQEERYAVVVFMSPPAGFPGYRVPRRHETGIEDIRAHILRRRPPHAESDVA